MGEKGSVGTGPLAVGAAIIALTLGAVSCGAAGEQPSAPSGSRQVTFESTDGVRLAGRLFGDGNVGVVLSHMLPADQSSWYDFAETLADHGYLVLTYDFRGYCPGGDAGCSGGEKQVAAIWQDVMGAIAYLRDRDVARIMLVGASMGGTASLIAAARDPADVAAVVTLSAPESIQGLTADANVLAGVTAAKLFIAGEFDQTGAANAAKQLWEEAPQPKRLEIVGSNDHGTDLLNGNQLETVRMLIINYLAQYSQGG